METTNIKTDFGVWLFDQEENPECFCQILSVSTRYSFVPLAESVHERHICWYGPHWAYISWRKLLWFVPVRTGTVMTSSLMVLVRHILCFPSCFFWHTTTFPLEVKSIDHMNLVGLKMYSEWRQGLYICLSIIILKKSLKLEMTNIFINFLFHHSKIWKKNVFVNDRKFCTAIRYKNLQFKVHLTI